MTAPTVREVLDACDEHPGFPGCKSCEVLDRLDPDTQVIVTRDSLAAALHESLVGCCWNETLSAYEDPPGWTHAADADAILAALRGAPATTITDLPDIGTGYPEPILDAAWAEAEAALPEGWMLEVVRRGAVAGDVNPWTGYTMTAKVGRYEAVAAHAWAGGPTWKRIEPPEAHADGPTPSAALRALLPVLAALRGAK